MIILSLLSFFLSWAYLYFTASVFVLGDDRYLKTSIPTPKFAQSTYIFLNRGKSLLQTSDYFRKRLANIEFLRDYSLKNRTASFSLVIPTFERYRCLNRSFYRIMQYRPPNTEIIVSDDSSKTEEKVKLLNEIADNYFTQDVYVIRHINNSGAFHTKLDGFLYAIGSHIMSLDDDDTFDPPFYIEMAQNIDEKYDFIMPLHFGSLRWIRLPYHSLRQFISSYHNHVTFAFRRKLMEDVDYPFYDIPIIRDDCPLMVPLYIKTNMVNVKYYHNSGHYWVDDYFKEGHEGSKMAQKDKIRNGRTFLIEYATKINRLDTIPYIKSTYMENRLD
ncbi:hypothetical protein TRFO_11690 [Tritrichomonas foetus]|uniref:Glycosyltransferase 2-like domain-containing protein n=1 Tax=Tritrichomonas foetus TaxID=1144522 RepID=A0A1J4J2T7_9EUKA|nr:hypothetical protein TRFO_11690 [Tritrichomonas foetus]|eukprot:OHS93674.1 hypothetical protein TRFO_11690 [Tritrichomonas foetus]